MNYPPQYKHKLLLCTGEINKIKDCTLLKCIKLCSSDIKWYHQENKCILYICFNTKEAASRFVKLKIKDFKIEYAPFFIEKRWEELHTKYDRTVKPSVYLYVKSNVCLPINSWN